MCIFVTTGLAGRKYPFWPERLIGVLREAARSDALAEAQERFEALALKRSTAHAKPSRSNPTFDTLVREPDSAVECVKGIPEGTILEWLQANEAWVAELSRGQRDDCSDSGERLLTWASMRQLQAEGVTFGSHTVTHPILTSSTNGQIARELSESRRHLGQELADSNMIAYPNGDANRVIADHARRAGYRYGFRNSPGIWRDATDALLIPRVNLWDGKMTDSTGRFSAEHLEYSIFWKSSRAT